MARRLLHAAEEQRKGHNPREARRLYTLALQKEPDSIATLKSCAEFLAESHDPELVIIRGHLSGLQPKDDAALLDYAEAAVDFSQWRQALNLLTQRGDKPAEPSVSQARYFNLLGICYLAAKRVERADQAYTEGLKRVPGQPVILINQAKLRILSRDPSQRNAAAEILDRFSQTPATCALALPTLLDFASSAENEPAQLSAWLQRAEECLQQGKGEIDLPLLAALKRWRPDQFSPRLGAYLQEAAEKRERADLAQRWLIDHEMYEEAIAYRGKLPPEFQGSPQSLYSAAIALAERKQIDQLDALLDDSAWKQAAAVSLAWKEWVRRQRTAGEPDLERAQKEDATWKSIVARASHDAVQLSLLTELASRWKWSKELEQTLWAAADEHESGLPPEALEALGKIYLAKQDAAGYLKVQNRQLDLVPDDPVAANNFAWLGFLLHREAARSEKLAADLCLRFPRSVDFLATAAFGHFQKGDIDGGLEILKPVPRETLLGTAPGMTYGWILAAKGDPDAVQFLKDADQWIFFPEEREILAAARNKIAPK